MSILSVIFTAQLSEWVIQWLVPIADSGLQLFVVGVQVKLIKFLLFSSQRFAHNLRSFQTLPCQFPCCHWSRFVSFLIPFFFLVLVFLLKLSFLPIRRNYYRFDGCRIAFDCLPSGCCSMCSTGSSSSSHSTSHLCSSRRDHHLG